MALRKIGFHGVYYYSSPRNVMAECLLDRTQSNGEVRQTSEEGNPWRVTESFLEEVETELAFKR